MATTSTDNSGKIILYLILGVLGLGVLVGLYFVLRYAALNLFLTLDLSVFGRLAPSPWPGYALLGLGLGAAAGAVAAQRRFRLDRSILSGAAGLVAVLGAGTLVGNTVQLAAPTAEAEVYERREGQALCPACATVTASTTKASPTNKYTAANLLDKDPATAWISDSTSGTYLTLSLHIPADQRLVGLRIGNGYGKSEAVFRSFSRVRRCRVSLGGGPETRWTLPDTRRDDLFIPCERDAGAAPATLVLHIDDTYAGDNHAEVALSGLTPVIEALTR